MPATVITNIEPGVADNEVSVQDAADTKLV